MEGSPCYRLCATTFLQQCTTLKIDEETVKCRGKQIQRLSTPPKPSISPLRTNPCPPFTTGTHLLRGGVPIDREYFSRRFTNISPNGVTTNTWGAICHSTWPGRLLYKIRVSSLFFLFSLSISRLGEYAYGDFAWLLCANTAATTQQQQQPYYLLTRRGFHRRHSPRPPL